MATEKTVRIGEFALLSGVLRVTDPCYDKDTWCSGTLDNVEKGLWEASVFITDKHGWGSRVAELRIDFMKDGYHEPIKVSKEKVEPTELTSIDVGVDSGQAGFFDDVQFPNEKSKYGEPGFYGMACTVTSSPNQAGTVGFGVVSSSGWGDGSYQCYVGRNKAGKIVSAKIVYLSDEVEEDDFEDEPEQA